MGTSPTRRVEARARVGGRGSSPGVERSNRPRIAAAKRIGAKATVVRKQLVLRVPLGRVEALLRELAGIRKS